MKWLRRPEWRDAFNEAMDRHLAAACSKAGIAIDALSELVGGHHAGMLWGCVFEDFLTRDLDDGRNILDDYLKRRGWKESASNRAYMTALRSSVMSLYEISDIVPDESFSPAIWFGEENRCGSASGRRRITSIHGIGWRRDLCALVHER